MYGGESIPLYTDTSLDWHNQNAVPNYAVDLNVGVNEYTFGRTTPDNKFIVSTGLVSKPYGIEMTGGKKSKVVKKKKESSLTNKVSKFFVDSKDVLVKPFESTPNKKVSKSKKPVKKESSLTNKISKFFVDTKDVLVKPFESTPNKKISKSKKLVKKESSLTNKVSKFFVDSKDVLVKPFEATPNKKISKSKKPVKKMKGGIKFNFDEKTAELTERETEKKNEIKLRLKDKATYIQIKDFLDYLKENGDDYNKVNESQKRRAYEILVGIFSDESLYGSSSLYKMYGGLEVILAKWDDLLQIKIGDHLKYNNEQYEIADTDYDQNYGGARFIFVIKTNKGSKEIVINHRGDVTGYFGNFDLINEELQLVKKNT